MMKLKSAFEIADGVVKVKTNNLNAIRTLRPHEFKRESDDFKERSAKEKTLMKATSIIKTRDAKMSMLLSGYEE